MNRRKQLKETADTYFYRISKTALFFTAIFAVAVLYLVHAMNVCPSIAVKYYCIVPEILKNISLICVFVLISGTVFEAASR